MYITRHMEKPDVYKRQLKVSLNDFGFLPKQPAIANRQENDPDITAEPAPPPTEVSVSYTHLDVSKRQHHSFSSGLSRTVSSARLHFLQENAYAQKEILSAE